jgi:N-acetylglucosamine kinase-like BadF-type ATPase
MILIVESGSTKTEWRYIADPNEAYESFYSDGINPYYQSADEITIAQKSILVELAKKTIQQVFYYGTGITDDAKRDIIRQVIKPFVGEAEITVENDLVAAGISLCGDDAGIACILGTGANSGYFEGGKLKEQIPPLCFWLGDEGSGAVLGKLLIADCLKNQLPDWMAEKLLDEYELTPAIILENVYKKPFPNRFLAKFTPFILEHIDEPSIFNLVYDSFDAFLVRNVMQYPLEDMEVGFVGSIAHYFRDTLEIVASERGIIISEILQNPMDGLVRFHNTTPNP